MFVPFIFFLSNKRHFAAEAELLKENMANKGDVFGAISELI